MEVQNASIFNNIVILFKLPPIIKPVNLSCGNSNNFSAIYQMFLAYISIVIQKILMSSKQYRWMRCHLKNRSLSSPRQTLRVFLFWNVSKILTAWKDEAACIMSLIMNHTWHLLLDLVFFLKKRRFINDVSADLKKNWLSYSNNMMLSLCLWYLHLGRRKNFSSEQKTTVLHG